MVKINKPKSKALHGCVRWISWRLDQLFSIFARCMPNENREVVYNNHFEVKIDRLRSSLVQLCHMIQLNKGRTQSVNWWERRLMCRFHSLVYYCSRNLFFCQNNSADFTASILVIVVLSKESRHSHWLECPTLNSNHEMTSGGRNVNFSSPDMIVLLTFRLSACPQFGAWGLKG